jgi:FlaA1/EpsC-like NDP-sugar epimerase
MMKELLIIGAGGHAKVVLEAIIEGGGARVVGFVAPLGVKSRLVVNPLHEQIRFFGLPFFERLDG